MGEAEKAGSTKAEQTIEKGSLLDEIVTEGRMGTDTVTRERGKDLVKAFLGQVLEHEVTVGRDTLTTIDGMVNQIDHLVSIQLNEILHNESFQKLEASWRGLKYLLDQSETGTMLKVRVLNVSKKELLRDLQRAAEFDQSALFKKVYEQEFGTFGGEPYAALIGDYEFSNHPEDVELLEKISQVAAGAHAPFLSAASPKLMGLDSYTSLDQPRDVAKIFDTSEYAKWKSFRQSEDSKYVGLTAPRILMRLPYGAETKPVEGFNYEEGVDGTDHSKYLWGNGAYALGARLTNAFAQYGWCAAIRGVEGGGLVEGLPAHTFRTDEGDVALKCPTEISITDRREKELADAGLIPLVHQKGRDNAAFFSVQSCNKPKVYDSAAATANARLSAQLPYMMAVCRFAHYLKSIMRDKIGSFMSRQECEAFLNKWIKQYVVLDDMASQSTKAKFPLREAKVDVEEIPGKPGAYRAIAFLRPHFQLDELTVSLRLVAELPKSAKG
ncbi:MAG: type VI secretion system contractile sheath large subunit [Acidobacteriota bacterium]|nr:type VI secretion system contractile sheath large subunit [Acidobacteriota bacterium]